jgi:hypothetical protein
MDLDMLIRELRRVRGVFAVKTPTVLAVVDDWGHNVS